MEKQQSDSGGGESNAHALTPPHHVQSNTESTLSVNAGNKAVSSSALTGLPDLKELSVVPDDLMSDKLLLAAPRLTYNGQTVPSLGGIPLLARLGVGGMGAVYFGIHPRLKLEVAVKILPFQLAEQQPDLIARFFREAKIAATVESPHLVRVTDVNEDCGLHYLVMEYVNGVTAGSYLKQNGKPGLPEALALEVCIGATEGLVAAHNEDIVHRDIKPDNIMIPRHRHKLMRATPRSESQSEPLVFASAKLSDLGLARGSDAGQSLTCAQAVMGTPGYMAPEQAIDAKTAGKPADVFSMGATLYALLCGTTPHSGGSQMETILSTIQKPHSPLRPRCPSTSDATCALVERTLMKDPNSRYGDAEELLAALKECRAALGGPPLTGQSGRPTRDVGSTMIPKSKLSAAPSNPISEQHTLTPAGPMPSPVVLTPSTPVVASHATPPPVAPTPAPVATPDPVPVAVTPPPTPAAVAQPPQKSKTLLIAAGVLLAMGALAVAYKFGMTEEKKIIEKKENPPAKQSEPPAADPSVQKEDPRYREEVLAGQQKFAANDYLGAKIAFSIAKTLAIKKEAREFAENGLLAAQKAGFNAKLLDAQTALAGDHVMDAKQAFEAARDLWPDSPDIAKATDGIAAAEKTLAEKRNKSALKNAMLEAYSAEDEAGRDAAYKKAKWEAALAKAPAGAPEIEKIKARIDVWTKASETKP